MLVEPLKVDFFGTMIAVSSTSLRFSGFLYGTKIITGIENLCELLLDSQSFQTKENLFFSAGNTSAQTQLGMVVISPLK
jgi:hypothetical protein